MLPAEALGASLHAIPRSAATASVLPNGVVACSSRRGIGTLEREGGETYHDKGIPFFGETMVGTDGAPQLRSYPIRRMPHKACLIVGVPFSFDDKACLAYLAHASVRRALSFFYQKSGSV